MKLKFVTSVLCCMMILFTECSNPTVSNLFAKMEECKVMGVVRDESGNPIVDVEIISGREKMLSNARGVFTFDRAKVKDDRCVMTFKKEGYCSITRACAMQENLKMDVVMLKKDTESKNYAVDTINGNGGEIKVGKMKVTVPGGIVDRLGREYKGKVAAEVFYLDPNDKNFQTAMPGGDLEATRSDNSSTFLKSYGMVDVTLTDEDGNPLNLGKNSEAELTFPVPAGMEKNTPDSIPLWAFNEDKGLWEEEGMAKYDADAKVYKGMVKHFSWHNLDVPSERVTVKGKVEDCNGYGIEGVKVIVGQTSAYTDANGQYSVYIPQNTDVDIYVRSTDYYNYKEGKPVVVKGTMEAEVEAPTVKLPCMCNLTGKIKNSCGERPLCTVYIDYMVKGEQFTSTPLWSNPNDGTFSIKFPKDASSMMLHVETKDGNSIPRPYFNINGDIDTGEIEVCIESQEKEVVNITYGDKSFKIPVDENTLDVASDIGGIMGAITQIVNLFGGEKIEYSPRFMTIASATGDTVLTIHVKDFCEGKNTYDAEVSYCTNGVEATGKGFFTVVEKKDKSTLLTLSCGLKTGKKGLPVTITGMFSIPDMTNGMKVIGNIDHVPSACPSFPKPIFATFQYMVDGHWITGGVYKDVYYEGYKKKLLEAGAELVDETFSEKGYPSGIFYHKDYMVSVDPLRILVMDKPSSKEKIKHRMTIYNEKENRYVSSPKDNEEFEIKILELKAIGQTLSTHPVTLIKK